MTDEIRVPDLMQALQDSFKREGDAMNDEGFRLACVYFGVNDTGYTQDSFLEQTGILLNSFITEAVGIKYQIFTVDDKRESTVTLYQRILRDGKFVIGYFICIDFNGASSYSEFSGSPDSSECSDIRERMK